MDSPSGNVSWSPSAQLVNESRHLNDNSSWAHHASPPSSPFISNADTKSRNASTTWTAQSKPAVVEDDMSTLEIYETPLKTPLVTHRNTEEKENTPDPSDAFARATLKLSRMKRELCGPSPCKDKTSSEQRDGTNDQMRPGPTPSRHAQATPRCLPLNSTAKSLKSLRMVANDDATHASLEFTSPLTEARVCREDAAPETTNVDDTCFSTFSEIPDMTLFARIGQSPFKHADTSRTPRGFVSSTPRKRASPSRSPSPTPRRRKTPGTSTNNDGTTFLIDFTQQIEGVGSVRAPSPQKSSTESNLLQYINSQRSPHKSSRPVYATPQKQNNILHLLDFELPPAPTPRSVPTITVRELESLKSSYLSQISSLKATLSGREAEVESLKRAVSDAERRVGEAQEALGEEKICREQVEQEREGWERRGKEVENVLKNVKEEVIRSEAEKEDMARKLEDFERRVAEAEDRAIKAEERFAEALAARADGSDGDATAVEEQVQRLLSAQIDSKIEAVSRELHAVYKDKHERKVATLKKSYEARGEKKCADLRAQLTKVEQELEQAQAGKDNSTSSAQGNVVVEAELKAQIEELKASIARLEGELMTSQEQQTQLEHELQQERIEKGDLVAAVDEMLALQSDSGPTQEAVSMVADFRRSINQRPSGLKTPGSSLGESRIGRGPPSGLPKGSSVAGKSKMLANIERMGARAGSGSTLE